MEVPPWFKRVADLLVQEKRAYRESGLPIRMDREVAKSGIVKFAGRVDICGKRVLLEIWYPGGFPFVPPQVYAPELTLKRHQNPYAKNLCVWPTGTQPWDWGTTGAELVQRAISLIKASWQEDDTLAAEEEEAPDLRGAFMPYSSNSALLIPEDALQIPAGGWGQIQVLGPTPSKPRRGLLKVVRFFSPERLDISCPSEIIKVVGGDGEVVGPWVKINDYPPNFPIGSFVDDFFEWFSEIVGKTAWQAVPRGPALGWPSTSNVDLAAVAYPEEFEYRDYTRSNWLVVLRYRDRGQQVVFRPLVVPLAGGYFQRIPRLTALSQKKVSVIGLGAIGSYLALELARAGVHSLCLIDGDILEPANLVRHICSLDDVGLPKSEAVAKRIRLAAPSCEVTSVPLHIGSIAPEVPEKAEEQFRNIVGFIQDGDLIVDAAADDGVSYLINTVGAELRLPQLYVRGTNGGWGGEILRVVPPVTGCFECFMRKSGRPKQPDEDKVRVPALGCADRTFTGSGFDMASIALLGTRLAVQVLLRDEEGGYPDADYDYLSWMNTAESGEGLPEVRDKRRIPRSEDCRTCSGLDV